MDPNNAIEVKNMSKSFRINRDKSRTLKEAFVRHKKGNTQVKEVLSDISLSIKKGDTVALIGVNGSGKSTLLKLMTKIIYPTSGTLETNGKLTSLLELGAGFHPDFTGRENIYFNASIFGLTRKDIDKRIDEIIEFSELGAAIDDPIRTYSSGMYMRLAFSVAINVDAEILLIDEILAVGDQHFQEKCFRKLRELKESDKTIVIVSHALGSLKDLCSRAVWIYKGELRADGDPKFVIEEYLDQTARDNHEERKKALETGERAASAVLYIDKPRDLVSYTNDSLNKLEGWAISDAKDHTLRLMLDGQSLPFRRKPRTDVYEVYEEDYTGFMDAATIGWVTDKESLPRLSAGRHKLEAEVLDDQGQLLKSQAVEFIIE